MDVRLFLVEPTGRARVTLRRYRPADGCAAGRTYCNAEVEVGEVDLVHDGSYPAERDPAEYPRSDVRWPTACDACGRPFEPGDPWQVNQRELWASADGTVRATVYDLPAGATFDAPWMGDLYKGPDGRAWCVQLPDGVPWPIYGPATNTGARWEITGTAPAFTARPSIQSARYHGWLTDGILRPC